MQWSSVVTMKQIPKYHIIREISQVILYKAKYKFTPEGIIKNSLNEILLII